MVCNLMVRWEKSFSMRNSVLCYWCYICILLAERYKVRLDHTSDNMIMQVVVAGEVMLTVVLLCESLVVPRCWLMWVWVERLRSNLVLLVRGPRVHRGTLHFDVCHRLMNHSLNMLDCMDRLHSSVGMRYTLSAIQSQHMTFNIVMLDSTVLGLRLEVVAPLVVLVLKVLHQAGTLVVLSPVSIRVAAGIGMHGGLVRDDVPSRHMLGSMGVVVAAAPVRIEVFGAIDGLKVMVLVRMRVVNNSSMMLLEAWANLCVDVVPGLCAVAKGVVLVVRLVDRPVEGLGQVGLHELVAVAIVDIVFTIVMVPSERIFVDLCLNGMYRLNIVVNGMYRLNIVVLLHGGPGLTLVQVGV